MSDSSSKKAKGLSSLLRLWPFLRPHSWVLFAALFALVFTAALNLSLGQAVRLVVDQGFVDGSIEKLNTTLKLFLVVVVFIAIGTFSRYYLVTWLGERVSADIRVAVFNQLLKLEPHFFEENRSGEIMSRLTTDTTLLQSIIGSSLSFALRSFLMMLGGLVMLMLTNIKLTLVVFGALPLVMLPIFIFGKRVRTLSRDSQDSVADVGTYAGEIFQQIKTVQSYARETYERMAFTEEVEKAFRIARSRILNRGLLAALVMLFAFSAIGVMVYVGANSVLQGNMTGGELAAFIFYAIMVAGGVAAVSEVLGELQRAAGATERLLDLLSESPSIYAPEVPETMRLDVSSHIRFDNVNFAYPSRRDTLALEQISIDIQRGETIALVGPSGAGKSTLFELLQRFYDPSQGEVLVNGKNVKSLALDQLRTQMALVPQQPTLFSADVWQNIRYGNLNASEDEVKQAAKAAHAHEFIEKLPEQYDSFLGESGVRLSGGQKQRIVIARAILNDPEILLLDEATSALDAESEKYVQEALDNLMKSRTTIIIAHRLATVLHADRIIVLDEGKIVAHGNHDSLLKESELYQRLAALQFAG